MSEMHYNISLCIILVGWEGRDWIQLSWGSHKWRDIVHMITDFLIP